MDTFTLLLYGGESDRQSRVRICIFIVKRLGNLFEVMEFGCDLLETYNGIQ